MKTYIRNAIVLSTVVLGGGALAQVSAQKLTPAQAEREQAYIADAQARPFYDYVFTNSYGAESGGESGEEPKRELTLEEVVKEKQNPMSGFKSVFLQNITLPVGEGNANSLSVQPVFPFTVGKVKINTYTIIPIQWIPAMQAGGDRVFGMGNVLFNAFLRPAGPPKSAWVWGFGPTLQIPTRTSPELGSNRLSMGPAALLYYNGKTVSGGVVAQNFWSLGGTGINRVDLFSAQYVAYYNFPKAWYLESNATVTANWLDEADNRWTLPLGGGVGKTFKMGRFYYSASMQGFYNAVAPKGVGRWMAIAQLQIIFTQ